MTLEDLRTELQAAISAGNKDKYAGSKKQIRARFSHQRAYEFKTRILPLYQELGLVRS